VATKTARKRDVQKANGLGGRGGGGVRCDSEKNAKTIKKRAAGRGGEGGGGEGKAAKKGGGGNAQTRVWRRPVIDEGQLLIKLCRVDYRNGGGKGGHADQGANLVWVEDGGSGQGGGELRRKQQTGGGGRQEGTQNILYKKKTAWKVNDAKAHIDNKRVETLQAKQLRKEKKGKGVQKTESSIGNFRGGWGRGEHRKSKKTRGGSWHWQKNKKKKKTAGISGVT